MHSFYNSTSKQNQHGKIAPSVLLVVFVFVCWLPAATVSSAQIESVAFPVVQLDESARVAALGGRSPALTTDDVGALFSNPALLSTLARKTISVSYLNHIGSITAGWISYAVGVDSLTTAGVGIRYLTFGSIEKADEEGVRNGTFSASDMSITVGASRSTIPSLTYGVNVNFLLSSIDGFHSSALTADAGVFYEMAASGTTLGATIHHAGFVLSSFGRRDDRVPFDIRIGLTKRLTHMPLLLSVTAYRLHSFDGGPDDATALSSALYHLILGAEFVFSDSFQIRFGYNHRRHDELRMKSRLDLAGISFGTGIRLSRIAVDYAFSSWSSLGGLHRFSVRTGL